MNMPDVTTSYGEPIDFIDFVGYIIDDHSCLNYDDHSCLNYCNLTKLSQIVYQYWYVKILDVTASYGMHPNFITFFANFAQNWPIFMSEVFYLHQTLINCIFDVNINISL